MPTKLPRLPNADDLPEIESDNSVGDDSLALDNVDSEQMSAETDVAESLEDLAPQSFEETPQGPLNFDGGLDMGRH